MIGAAAAIVLNGFREARRNRVTMVVAAFAILLLFSTALVSEVTVATFDRVLTDVGLGTMSLLLVFLTVFLSSGMIGREIERRTIFLVVSRPISRTTFLVSRLAGNMLTLAVLLTVMTPIFVLQLLAFRSAVTWIHLAAIGMMWFELLVITCVGFTVSTFSGPVVSALVTGGFYLAGHLSPDIYAVASRADNAALRVVGKALYYVLPNLDRLNLRPNATYQVAPELGAVAASVGHAVVYCVVLLALATWIFERRDFK